MRRPSWPGLERSHLPI
jgi:hypothetical protein